MPRSGISYESVAESINALEKAGVEASIRRIRERLGSGSLSTIAEHKRTYLGQLAESLDGHVLPDPVSQALMKGAHTFWQELVDAAQGQIQSLETEHAAKIGELNAELGEAVSASANLKDENGALRQELEEVSKQLREAREVAELNQQSLSESLANAQRQEEEVRHALESLQQSREREKDLIKERDRAVKEKSEVSAQHRTDLADCRQAIAASNEKLEQSTAENHRLSRQHQEIKMQLDKSFSALKAAQDRIGRLETEQTRWEEDVETSAHRIKELGDELARQELKTEKANSELTQVRATNDRVLVEKDQRISELSGIVDTLKHAIHRFDVSGG